MFHLFKDFLRTKQLQRRFPKTRIHTPAFFEKDAVEGKLITLAEGVELLPGARLIGRVTVGRYSYFSFDVEAYASTARAITFGAFVSVATGACFIASHQHDETTIANFPVRDRVLNHPEPLFGAPITIGNDVWVGARAVILPGVTVGDGAIIGAGSLVVSGTDIKPYEIWAGNPAKKIKDRFPLEALERLRLMKWWEWDIEEIKKNKEMFDKPVV